jgi:predicted lactoylglutathione lyase
MENQDSKKGTNWFVRIGLILLVGLIISMIIYKFFYREPIADISSGLIVLLAFAIVLALSESFDSFSVGKILTLSRKIKEKDSVISNKESAIKQVENEKRELLSQIITLSNNFSQRQSNTNIYGATPDTIKQFTVQKADEPEVEILKQKEQEEENKATTTTRKRIDFRKVEEIAMQYFIKDNNVDVSKMFKEVKLQAFEGIDPISDTSPIYDGYINDIDKEVFIEIRPTPMMSSMITDRLYLMLSKIHHYRQFRKSNCYLNLILVEIPYEDRDDTRFLNRILELFRPALSSGLLKITTLKFNERDLTKIYRED